MLRTRIGILAAGMAAAVTVAVAAVPAQAYDPPTQTIYQYYFTDLDLYKLQYYKVPYEQTLGNTDTSASPLADVRLYSCAIFLDNGKGTIDLDHMVTTSPTCEDLPGWFHNLDVNDHTYVSAYWNETHPVRLSRCVTPTGKHFLTTNGLACDGLGAWDRFIGFIGLPS